jgi:hypothetical protein
MNLEMNEMKKRLSHQIAEDFYSRFESNEQKLERLRGLRQSEVALPRGFDIEGEIRVPTVSETHEMLLGGVQSGIGPRQVPVPEESVTLKIADGKRKEIDPETGAE